MTIILPPRTALVYGETDVLVAGGGPAGIGAAVAAARSGRRVMLLEKRGFLGGNITAAYVETCNHFMHHLSFQTSGIWAEMEEGYRAQFGRSGDIRPNAPHRFSSEYLKIFFDAFVGNAGVEICLHSFVNEVVVENGVISHVVIQGKQGPAAIKVKQVIDCTGDGDLAFAAGAPFDQGRDRDHRCQPGTLNFRIGGVDAAALVRDGNDQLKELNRRFREDYRAGKTGLSCKRQDIPMGRLTENGLVSYINYPCAYGVDPTSFADLTRGEIECRRYIPELCAYMKENFPGFEKSELVSIAPEIGFRDSRRIRGDYRLTIDDVLSGRHFDDAIAVYPQFYDMLSPDANMNEGSPRDAGYNGYICSYPKDGLNFEIPYRCLLPLGVENLLTAGRCISADHVAESGIRAISACMYTGQAAGTAAGLALQNGVNPRSVNTTELREKLRAQNCIL
ncbi:MAG: FAD-dependent oxidoreductase [Treponema sp.]|nr:FAD-dependent oxidoreductase [Treponema sp.]